MLLRKKNRNLAIKQINHLLEPHLELAMETVIGPGGQGITEEKGVSENPTPPGLPTQKLSETASEMIVEMFGTDELSFESSLLIFHGGPAPDPPPICHMSYE